MNTAGGCCSSCSSVSSLSSSFSSISSSSAFSSFGSTNNALLNECCFLGNSGCSDIYSIGPGADTATAPSGGSDAAGAASSSASNSRLLT